MARKGQWSDGYPTPRCSDWRSGSCGQPLEKRRLNDTIAHEGNGGQLNPAWVEWLMGWPVGWTALDPLSPAVMADWAAAVSDGTWWAQEPACPRVANGVKQRKERLQGIGNGQVAVVVAAAWAWLVGEETE